MTLYHGQVTQRCEVCKQEYRPRTGDQRFCGSACRAEGKKAEGRAARRAWWLMDRASEAELTRMAEQRRSAQR
jgi:hypothetical protein